MTLVEHVLAGVGAVLFGLSAIFLVWQVVQDA